MARLVLATRAQIDRITRETHALWGGGLSYEDYRDLWEELGSSAWATRWARYYVWEGEDGQILSSLKLYRPQLRVGSRVGRCAVLGAVFTPSRLRRRGHAAETVQAVLEESEQAEDMAALLFSDIGTAYYARFGFRALPAREQVGRLPPGASHLSGDLRFRSVEAQDLPFLASAHAASSAARSVAVVRDAEHWKFLWTRSRSFFARTTARATQHDWHLVQRGSEPAGYVISVVAGNEWNLREVGSADGDPATMTEILIHAGALAYRSGARRVYGWLPEELQGGLAPWRLSNVPRRRALPMLKLQDRALERQLVVSPRGAFIPFQDQF